MSRKISLQGVFSLNIIIVDGQMAKKKVRVSNRPLTPTTLNLGYLQQPSEFTASSTWYCDSCKLDVKIGLGFTGLSEPMEDSVTGDAMNEDFDYGVQMFAIPTSSADWQNEEKKRLECRYCNF